ncbi:histidine kinase dimerization/phospho-acceptor domain-containing protein [Metabacillus sp. B2-18]|uniref:histidine kinase dimerization/phospho-acceptor domain-containing protein n=1 Tax=Metabacillus sp. B2-18 TaxID=2897333 RepID=UPI001E4C2D0D|nr:histidine kinase dimerization/phospho-acceptor domain-containing protein [Metabacillus sp. B2-18]UGB28805.1 hypothetical protein LPC09_13470 [Metabacillus sp. B2-18]
MYQLINSLLIDLLLILTVILIVNIINWNSSSMIGKKHYALLMVGSILIILNISLSVHMSNGFYYDLRFIPFLLAGFYGGRRVLFPLAALLISYRLFLYGGDEGFIGTLICTCISTIAIQYISPKLYKKRILRKVFMLTLLSFFYSILAFLVPSILFGFNNVPIYIAYSIILSGSTFFVTYLCELLINNYIYQQQHVKYAKLETVSHLAASISHEVKNPLTSVKGFLQLALEEKNLPIHVNKYISTALSEAERASDIITQYLTFAKPQQEILIILDIETEIRNTIELILPLANSNCVETFLDFRHKHNIIGDPSKFKQVLLNVFKNAIEAMEDGGTLSIMTSEKTI